MELLLLLCVIGVVAAAPADSPDKVHYDTIVIGLGSAGTTAATELARAGKRVLALEAQSRIGGRVHTVPFGDGVVEVGAEWVHGNESSRTYELATQHHLDLKFEAVPLEAYRSDGTTKYTALVNELFKTDFTKNPPATPVAYGTYYTQKLREYLAKNKPDVLQDEDFVNGYLQWANLATNNYEGSNDWNDVPTGDHYDELGGPQSISWHRLGYKTFFDLMLNTYECEPDLSNLDMKLSTEVTHITAPQNPTEKVVVTCKDGSTYEADSAIVTVSLGVLKATHSTLFSPPLPKDKQIAIEKIAMGVVDKVIFSFEEAWWPKNANHTIFAFLWKGDDRSKVPAEDFWTTRVFGAHTPMGSSNTLTMWINGDVAKEVENLPEDVLKAKCLQLLQRFVGNSIGITVPQPTRMIRSTWYSNPFTRGSYSFESLLASQYPDARSWLASPLVDSSGAPRVLFAGEATNLNHFSTVHGASETGHREAQRLLRPAA